MNFIRTVCITVLGSGFLRPAPATWGSAAAVLLYAALWWSLRTCGAPRPSLEASATAAILLAVTLSVAWGPWAIERFQSKDPRSFVLDEFAGQWLALLALPLAWNAEFGSFATVAAGQFVFFRFFDILKPPPARQLESLPAGWGIMIDDLFAGLYSNIAGQVVWLCSPIAASLGVSGIAPAFHGG